MRKALLLPLLVSAVLSVSAAEKMTIAILDIESENVPSIILNAVSEIVRSEFTNFGNFTVVERSKLDKIIEEQELALSGVLDESSAAEIGALVSAQKIVLGELNPVGDEYVLTLRIIDVETGQAEFSARETSILDRIEPAAEKASRDLAQKIVSGNKQFFTALSPGGYYLRSFVPGLGQFYADKNAEGAIFLGLNIAAVGVVATGAILYLKASADYHNLPAGTPQDEFDEKFAAWEDATDFLNYALIGLAAAYALNLLDALLIARPDFSSGEDRKAKVTPMLYPEAAGIGGGLKITIPLER
ncbi:MAG: hypothetical protein JW874_07330 [Spirochaetales bacterium]|nr:hypothetical protein [Spirochaetales bacterium]